MPVIPAGRPAMDARCPDQPRLAIDQYEGAVRQGLNRRLPGPANAGRRHAVLVHPPVQLIGRGEYTAMGGHPGLPEGLVVRVAAGRAGAMAGGERSRFVQEEEFSPPIWLHHVAVPTAKLELADDPPP